MTCAYCPSPAYTIGPPDLCRAHLREEQETMPYTINEQGALEGVPDGDAVELDAGNDAETRRDARRRSTTSGKDDAK